jgi:NAD+ diphosphatase
MPGRPPLAFAVNGLVRHTAEQDPGALDRARTSEGTRTVVMAEGAILLAGQDAGGAAVHSLDVAEDLEILAQVYLGTMDGVPIVATAVPTPPPPSAGALVDLRRIAAGGLVAERELGLLAEASSLLSWHLAHRFCARCGGPTRSTRSGFRRDCGCCGAEHFPRTDPVVIMLVTRGDTCLLGRGVGYAGRGYSCLAGFLEPGETIEDAVRRETFEEAGVEVGAVRYLRSQPWPFPSSLMIGCAAEALTEELLIDTDELADARWFTRAEVRAMLHGRHPEGLTVPPPLAIAHHLLLDFLG